MSWYSEVTYFIEHLNRNAQVTAQQGLRQGCQLAPLLWAISVGYVYKTVARNATNPITTPWLQDHTSTYADDIHMMATAKTVSSLDSILLHFGTMLDALTDNDMVINAVKSAFLLKHRGSFIKRWLRRHRRTTPDGDVIYFRTPKGTEYQIPLREQRTYLGVKISYHSMARHTTSHRLQAANSAWQRLRGILCSARNLALADRIALWKATVLPTLMYGLAAVGPGPRRMQAMIIKHARAMAKSFAHLHHEPSQLVLTRCGIRPAAEQLHKETEALLRRFRTQVVCTPFITEENLLDLRLQAATLQADSVTHETEEALSSLDSHTHQCDTCGRSFSSFRLLRSHEATHHQQRTPAPSQASFDRLTHSLDGMPTCRHCGHRFRQWANLVQHIQRDRCQVLRRNKTASSQSGPETTVHTFKPGTAMQPPDPELEQSIGEVLDTDAPLLSGTPPGPAPDLEAPPSDTQSPDPGGCASSTSIPATHAAEAVVPMTPLQAWPLVRQHLEAGTWVQLLEMTMVQEYLAHHCPICLQWAATPAGIKCHMTHHHEEWSTLQTDTRAPLKGFRRHTTVARRYCHNRQINKDRHWFQCHVLSLCAFLQASHDRTGQSAARRHGSGRAGAALLCPDGTHQEGLSNARLGCPSSAPEHGEETMTGSAGQRQGQRRQRKRKGEGQGEQCPPHVGLQRWLRRGPEQWTSPSGNPAGRPTTIGRRGWTGWKIECND